MLRSPPLVGAAVLLATTEPPLRVMLPTVVQAPPVLALLLMTTEPPLIVMLALYLVINSPPPT